MAMETWSPGLNGAGLTSHQLGGVINWNAKPEGEGWQITGYRTVQTSVHPKYGSPQKMQVPIYSRYAGPVTPTPAAPAPPPPAATPTYEPKPAVPEAPAPAPAPASTDPTPASAPMPQGPDLSPLTKQIEQLSKQLADQQANYAQQLQVAEAGYQNQMNSLKSMYDQQFSSMRDMYDQQMNTLNMRITDMNNANNQDSWRIRAAQQAGSASANSVQSDQYAAPAGTEKLNRYYQPASSFGGSNNLLQSLLINPTLGGLDANPLAIGGVNL